jgi:hypothetical protein
LAAPRDEVEGLVVCRVGEHRLAFPAASVGNIAAWEMGDVPAPMARQAFSLPSAPGKMLVHGAFSLVVDGLEIITEPAPFMITPLLLKGAAGGALRGFVSVSNALIPLFGLAEFSRFVVALPSGQKGLA